MIEEEHAKRRKRSLAPVGRRLSHVIINVGTTYLETIIHIFKGNIGTGIFAMGDAFKNGGLAVGPVVTVCIAIISVHCQHILIGCSEKLKILSGGGDDKDYAETVELCFVYGPDRFKSWSKAMKITVNTFLCVTQFGFCSIYHVFIATNIKQVMLNNDINIDIHLAMLISLLPILLISLITTLKYLAPVSLVANIFMVAGISITLYFVFKDSLPAIRERNLYTNIPQMALYFGTAIYAFEGISLVLPLKHSMQYPQQFDDRFGVLNVGMVIITFLLMFVGICGYLKWGEEVAASLTLNLGNTIFAQCVKIVVSIGVLFGFPLQFFIPIKILWPYIQEKFSLYKRPLISELIVRVFFVLLTLIIAEIVPALGLFISLIGSLCSTSLALVFPPIMEMITARLNEEKKPGCFLYAKNFVILLLAVIGFAAGSWESLYRIIKHFRSLEDM